MDLFLVNLILGIIILTLFILLSWVWPPDSPWSPWWRTSAKTARAAGKLAKITSKDIVYELGSGDGSFVRTIAKEFGAQTVGIEVDPARHLVAQTIARFQNIHNITFVKDNFNNQDVSKATVVFVYLVPRALQRLMPKLNKELKPGTKIISYVYKMDLPIFAKSNKEQLYVYVLPKTKK